MYGEIDFVLVNRAGRVLLSQKNGHLLETDAGLAKAYPGGVVKPVGDEIRTATRNAFEILRLVLRDARRRALAGGPRPEPARQAAVRLDGFGALQHCP